MMSGGRATYGGEHDKSMMSGGLATYGGVMTGP